MKHEIEIQDLPEGWEPVAYRNPEKGEEYIHQNQIWKALFNEGYPYIIVRKKQPRRIVLEETGDIRVSCYLLKIDDGNLILPPGRAYKIVEDNKCAE